MWKGGKTQVLEPGYNYKQQFKQEFQTLIVPPGQVVTMHEKQDRKGKKSRKFYEGEYMHLSWYGIQNWELIHIEKTDLKAEDLLTLWYMSWDGQYKYIYKVPIGDRKAPEDFPNDKIDHVEIPYGLTAELFEDGSAEQDGGSLIFSGLYPDELTHIDLHDYKYNDKVSRINITADKWDFAGIALDNPKIIEKSDEVKVANMRIDVNAKDIEAGGRQMIGGSVGEEVSEEWGLGGAMRMSMGTEIGKEGGMDGIVAKVNANVEIEINANYGESKTTACESYWEEEVTVSRDTVGTVQASLIVERGEMQFDATRKYRNTVTGHIIEDKGKISYKHATNARVEVF